MLFSKYLAMFLVFAAGIVIAAPSPVEGVDEVEAPTPVHQAARQDISIHPLGRAGFGYEGNNLTGKKHTMTALGCRQLYSSSGNDRWSSAEILKGYECKFYRNIFCLKNLPFGQGGEVRRSGPWSGGFPGGWDNKISSYKCARNGPLE